MFALELLSIKIKIIKAQSMIPFLSFSFPWKFHYPEIPTAYPCMFLCFNCMETIRILIVVKILQKWFYSMWILLQFAFFAYYVVNNGQVCSFLTTFKYLMLWLNHSYLFLCWGTIKYFLIYCFQKGCSEQLCICLFVQKDRISIW